MGRRDGGDTPGSANTPRCSWSHTDCESCPAPGAGPRLLTSAVLYCCVRDARCSKVRLHSHTKLEMSKGSSQGSDAHTPQQLWRPQDTAAPCVRIQLGTFSFLQACPLLFLYSLNSLYYSRFVKDTLNENSLCCCHVSNAEYIPLPLEPGTEAGSLGQKS